MAFFIHFVLPHPPLTISSATNPFPCLSVHILINYFYKSQTGWSIPDLEINGAPSNDDILEVLILGSATIKMEVSELTLKCRWRSNSTHSTHAHWHYLDGTYDFTTNARKAVVGRNKELDEGAGRQIWKCLDPLNCVAPAAFWKHGTWCKYGTWVKTWTGIFGVHLQIQLSSVWLRSRAWSLWQ